MIIIEDIIKKRKKVIIIIGSKKEVLEKINNLKEEETEKRDTELLKTVNRIWEAFNLNEKLYIFEKSGYKLED